MINTAEPLKKPFYYALGLHGAIILLLMLSGLTLPETVFKERQVNIVNASTVTKPSIKPEPRHHKPVVKREKPAPKRTIHKREAVKHVLIKKATVAKKTQVKKHHRKEHHVSHAAQRAHQKKLAEQKRSSALHAKAVQNTIARYQAMILHSISQDWLIPPGVNKKLSCKLQVQVAPDGTVLNVHLLSSSSNTLLDRSAIAAVYKASPLPVPSKASLFKQFKQITLIVRPENVLRD